MTLNLCFALLLTLVASFAILLAPGRIYPYVVIVLPAYLPFTEFTTPYLEDIIWTSTVACAFFTICYNMLIQAREGFLKSDCPFPFISHPAPPPPPPPPLL